MSHKLIYQDRVGRQVTLEVPWSLDSGFIPPPKIVFDYQVKDFKDTSEYFFMGVEDNEG